MEEDISGRVSDPLTLPPITCATVGVHRVSTETNNVQKENRLWLTSRRRPFVRVPGSKTADPKTIGKSIFVRCRSDSVAEERQVKSRLITYTHPRTWLVTMYKRKRKRN